MILDLQNFVPVLAKQNGQLYIFDRARSKYLVLTPEEWVRQAFIDYLESKGYPINLMQIEQNIAYPHRKKRPDIVVYDRVGNPFLLIECKAQSIVLDLPTRIQAETYNSIIKAPYIALTNGQELHIYEMASQTPLPALPAYPLC